MSSLTPALSAIRPAVAAFLTCLLALAVIASADRAIAQDQGDAATPAISLEEVMNQTQRTAGGSVRPPANAVVPIPMEPGAGRMPDAQPTGPKNPLDPLGTRGANSDTTLWHEIRRGETFTTQASNPQSAFLVQDAGVGWLELRAKGGPLQTWGAYALGGILALLVLFFLLRGRIKIEHGLSGQLIQRFAGWERFGHWMLATSFILLALTGLNLLFGKDYLMPLIGKDAFAELTIAGKWIHNNVAWAFMLALVWIFVAWVVHNLPSYYDLVWFAKGGGILFKGVHPPSKKFNAGQKLIFWSTIVLGASVSASGLSLLFPYELPMFAATFEKMNEFGISEALLGYTLVTELTMIEEMQYAQLWHTIVALAMIVIILAHIYIGSVGMQGAFAAMGSGMVDRNWAKEHHNLWVEDEDRRAAKQGAATPAE
ncbi:MAG: formate dehydrogenase subunit gamma [Pseudomonadota bacterium]